MLHLSENKTTLTQESSSKLLQRQVFADTKRKDQSYINDESIPSQIFPLIESYRDKVLAISNGRGQSALIIDDFFGDAHAILKDTHLKEIARIRNENNVEIMKLKKNLEAKLMAQGF